MTPTDTYKSVAHSSEGLFKDNGSRFISLVYPVETEAEVKSIIASLKKEYHDARHHCYAYRLGLDGSVCRSNDDGEPSGSAGRPILGQIVSFGLSDVLVVVVRYFGGIKLGIPGLIRAYRTSSADALLKAGTIEKVSCRRLRMRFSYAQLPRAMKIVKDMGLAFSGQDFGLDCSMEVSVRLDSMKDFLERTEKTDIFIDVL